MPFMPWLIRLGASAAPFAFGWLGNDVSEFIGNLNPWNDEDDAKTVTGWGIATLLLITIGGFLGWKAYKELK